jgi:hypothetical protein
LRFGISDFKELDRDSECGAKVVDLKSFPTCGKRPGFLLYPNVSTGAAYAYGKA